MKIIILHGDHIEKSYERLQRFIDVAKKRGWRIERITDNKQNISEALVSKDLFGKKKLVIIDGIKLINKKETNWLKKNKESVDVDIVVYQKSTLTKTALKILPQPDKIEEFKLPKLIWNFLDSFFPGNAKVCLNLLHKIIENEPLELVFFLLVKQVRDVYWAKVDSKSLPYPPWRVGKLKKQADKFDKKLLKKIINEFAEADIKSKTSKAKLLDELDFIMATKLE